MSLFKYIGESGANQRHCILQLEEYTLKVCVEDLSEVIFLTRI